MGFRRHGSNVCAERRGIGKKIILAIRAAMHEENVDLVAGDFNGAAWRPDSATIFRIVEEAKRGICALPMPAPYHCGDPDRFLAYGPTCVGFINRLNPIGLNQIDSGRYGFTLMFLVCARMIKASTTKRGSTSILLDGMVHNPILKSLVKGFS